MIAALRQELEHTEVPGRAAYLLARLGSEQRVAGDLEEARAAFHQARRAFDDLGDVMSVAKVLLSVQQDGAIPDCLPSPRHRQLVASG